MSARWPLLLGIREVQHRMRNFGTRTCEIAFFSSNLEARTCEFDSRFSSANPIFIKIIS